MIQLRKTHFTLLELLIVLIVLSFGMALTGIKIKNAYEEQQFLTEVQQVVNYLQTAQDLMLILDTDIEVKFKQDPTTKLISYWFHMQDPLSPMWAKLIKGEQTLKSTRWIGFENQVATQDNGIVLHFYSKGIVMSQGKLVLSPSEKGLDRPDSTYEICLVGYPHFIESQKYQRSTYHFHPHVHQEALYPKELMEAKKDDKAKHA